MLIPFIILQSVCVKYTLVAEIIGKTRGIHLGHVGHIITTTPHAHKEIVQRVNDHHVDIAHGITPVKQKLRLRTVRAERMRRAITLVGRVCVIRIAGTGCGGRTVLLCARMRVAERIRL